MRVLKHLLVLFVAAMMLAGCAVPPRPQVTLGGQQLEPYVAETPAERSTGLQGFDGLAEREAMVFVYPDSAIRHFAMKGVGFPIDVVFIGDDGAVTAIMPLDPGDTAVIESPGPSPYVVELPQGWAQDHGITVGSAFTYDAGR